MHDGVHLARHENIIGDIAFVEGEFFIAGQMGDIIFAPGDEVVHADDFMSLRKQSVAEVRAEKAGRARDQNSHVISSSSDLTVCEKSIDRHEKAGKVVLRQTTFSGATHADQRDLSYLDSTNL